MQVTSATGSSGEGNRRNRESLKSKYGKSVEESLDLLVEQRNNPRIQKGSTFAIRDSARRAIVFNAY